MNAVATPTRHVLSAPTIVLLAAAVAAVIIVLVAVLELTGGSTTSAGTGTGPVLRDTSACHVTPHGFC